MISAAASTSFRARRAASLQALGEAEAQVRAILASLPASGFCRVAVDLALDVLRRLERSAPRRAAEVIAEQRRLLTSDLDRPRVESALVAVVAARALRA